MSRLGRKPIAVPKGVEVKIDGQHVSVKGPLGALEHELPDVLEIEHDEEGGQIRIVCAGETKQAKAFHGLHRSLVANMVEGVSTGFSKQLEIHGVGYNIQLKGKELVLQIGFCHPVEMRIPEGLEVEIQQNAAQPDRPALFTIKGADKQALGQFAAEIRKVRPPEPYKGKGIRYVGEHVRRKVGKALAGLQG